MREFSRREKRTLRRIVVSSTAIVAVVIIAVLVVVLLPREGTPPEDKDNPTTYSGDITVRNARHIEDVSPSTLDRLDNGTILTFGKPDAKKTISLIADPMLLKKGEIFDGNILLREINAGKVRVNLYLHPNDPSRSSGVGAMVKVATCLRGIDQTETNSDTLKSIVAAAQTMRGSEDITAMSALMGARDTTQCVDTAAESAVKTSDNTSHFMTQYRMDTPEALFVGDKVIIGKDFINRGWMDMILRDKNLEDIVVS